MPARNTTPRTPDQLGLDRVLHTLETGANIVAIMDERELDYPVHYDPDADPDHYATLRDPALN